MAKQKKPTEYDKLVAEIREATLALHRAQSNFDYALPEYFDTANSELTSARQRLDALLNEAKKLKAAEC